MRHFSGMTRRLAGLASQQRGPALCSCSITTSAATAELPQSAAASDVPAGHEKSDLRPSISNISLNRRRDISLRNDIKFYSGKDEPLSLRELLRAKSHAEGSASVLFGVPDMGKVCSETHVPGYLKQADRLKELGVRQVFAVAVASPAKVQAWADNCGLEKKGKICPLSDKTGAFARLLGVEINPPDEAAPHCHRYAALVENGILVKLRVENDNASVGSSSAESMVELLEDAAAKKEAAKGRK